MKKLPRFLVMLALSAQAFAAEPLQTKASSNDAATNAAPTIAASQAKLTAPMALKDGSISQPARTELTDGGKAVFDFTVPKDGDYVVHAVAEAPDDDSNSFFINVDKAPSEDPLMIWDIELTNGFEERVVNWRGSGEAGSDEFTPKVFKLTAGAHKLFLVGRETPKLKSIEIRAVAK